eukprot:TRINITY_DN20466_c0_g1_i8.p1 TRINITY_DN20466_c0_g1~~TRINITY_DN20466_c0_g1_i8.p1  ORF type:complete len:615 (+),score=81.41 TRINITY_DN20466_c0_g1_i8:133-1977(+)
MVLLARRVLQERFASRGREDCGNGDDIEDGSYVVVLDGRHFPAFSSGDRGRVIRVDKDSLNCEVLFEGSSCGVPVALRHLKLVQPSARARSRSSSASPQKTRLGAGHSNAARQASPSSHSLSRFGQDQAGGETEDELVHFLANAAKGVHRRTFAVDGAVSSAVVGDNSLASRAAALEARLARLEEEHRAEVASLRSAVEEALAYGRQQEARAAALERALDEVRQYSEHRATTSTSWVGSSEPWLASAERTSPQALAPRAFVSVGSGSITLDGSAGSGWQSPTPQPCPVAAVAAAGQPSLQVWQVGQPKALQQPSITAPVGAAAQYFHAAQGSRVSKVSPPNNSTAVSTSPVVASEPVTAVAVTPPRPSKTTSVEVPLSARSTRVEETRSCTAPVLMPIAAAVGVGVARASSASVPIARSAVTVRATSGRPASAGRTGSVVMSPRQLQPAIVARQAAPRTLALAAAVPAKAGPMPGHPWMALPMQKCACGNTFLEDSVYCRRCGAPRPPVQQASTTAVGSLQPVITHQSQPDVRLQNGSPMPLQLTPRSASVETLPASPSAQVRQIPPQPAYQPVATVRTPLPSFGGNTVSTLGGSAANPSADVRAPVGVLPKSM